MGLLHEFRLLQQDAQLASADDSERHYLQQVVAALTALLEPGRVSADAPHMPSLDSLDGVPDEFVCPISQEVMLDPVTLEVGHLICERVMCHAVPTPLHRLA